MRIRAAFFALALLLAAPAVQAASCDVAVRRARPASLEDIAAAAGAHFGLPAGLIEAVIGQENAPWDPAAVGGAGEIGLGQIKPGTMLMALGMPANGANLAWAAWGLSDPVWNLCWTARLLKDNRTACGGDRACAVACYNAGPANCRYTARVLARHDAIARERGTP